MAKLFELLIVFFLALNLFSGMLLTTGTAAHLGIGINTGGDKTAENTVQNASEFGTGAPTGSTLFGLYNVLTNTLSTLGAIVFGGPTMLYNIGVPGYITTPLQGIMTVVYSLGLIKFLRGV